MLDYIIGDSKRGTGELPGGVEGCGEAWRGVERRGEVWRVAVRCGEVWRVTCGRKTHEAGAICSAFSNASRALGKSFALYHSLPCFRCISAMI